MYGKHLSHLICRGRESFDVVPAVFCGVCFGEKGLPIQNASGTEIHFSWYNNCYSLSLNVISLKLIFIVIPFHLKQSLFFFFLVSLPFNKCLIFHYFIFPRLIFFLFSLFIICLFSSASLFVFFFCAHTELQLLLLLLLQVYPKTHQEAIRIWLAALSGCL